MVDKEKRGEEGNWKKIEYLENDKSFLNEISIFRIFLKATIWWKKEKTVDSSFHDFVHFNIINVYMMYVYFTFLSCSLVTTKYIKISEWI